METENKKRILVYVCPECENIIKDNGMIGKFCRRKKQHENGEAVDMRLGELFVNLGFTYENAKSQRIEFAKEFLETILSPVLFAQIELILDNVDGV